MTQYSVSELSTLLNISQRRIQKLAKEGIIPKAARGKYDLTASVQSYVKYLQSIVTSKDDRQRKDSKSRWLDAKAEKAELELNTIKGKLIETDTVIHEWENVLVVFRAKMLNLANKITPRVAVCSGNVQEISNLMQSEIEDALTELAKYRLEEQ